MSYIIDITSAITRLNKWQRVTLAAMCAASMSPVIEEFAQSATRRAFFEEGLNAAWSSACVQSIDAHVTPTRAALKSLPESNCDDSNVPAHNVMESLAILDYALGAIVEIDSERWTKYACTEAAGCWSGYDFVLAYGKRTRKIDPSNPPLPGRLESLQIQSQLDLAAAMCNAGGLSNQIVEQAQASAIRLTPDLESVLPQYAVLRGWNERI